MAKMPANYPKHQRELYEFDAKNRDQVTQWLQWDKSAKNWMKTFTLSLRRQTHHIAGRTGKRAELHWFCNLIHVGAAAHTYGHDVNSNQFELSCLRAKMALEVARCEAKELRSTDESKWHWHPGVLASLYPRASLAGRISEIMARPGIEGSVFQRYGDELLAFLRS